MEEIELINKLVVLARQHGTEDADESSITTQELMDAMYEILETFGFYRDDFNIVFHDDTPQLEQAWTDDEEEE